MLTPIQLQEVKALIARYAPGETPASVLAAAQAMTGDQPASFRSAQGLGTAATHNAEDFTGSIASRFPPDTRWNNKLTTGAFAESGVGSWYSGAGALSAGTGFIQMDDITTYPGGRTLIPGSGSAFNFVAGNRYAAYLDFELGQNVRIPAAIRLLSLGSNFATVTLAGTWAAGTRYQIVITFRATASNSGRAYFMLDNMAKVVGGNPTTVNKFYRSMLLDLGAPGSALYGASNAAISQACKMSTWWTGTGATVAPLETFAMAPVAPSSWAGYEMAFLGDSITYQGWCTPGSEIMGLSQTLLGIGGTTISGTDANAMHQDVRVNSVPTTAQCVVVLGGSNDWAQSKALGTIASVDTATYMGAYNVLLGKLIAAVPTRRIFLCTIPWAKLMNRGGWSDTSGILNTLGLGIPDYNVAVRAIGAKWGCPVIDLYAEAGINAANFASFMTS